MTYGPAVLMDTANQGEAWSAATPSTSMVCGPWKYAGSLYQVLAHDASNPLGGVLLPQYCNILKSSDGGHTWSILDEAHAVLVVGYQSCFDGDHTISVCHNLYAETVDDPPLSHPMYMVEFNLETGLWGADSGPSPFEVMSGAQLMLSRSDGSKLMLISSLNGGERNQPPWPPYPNTANVYGASWSHAGGWSGLFDVNATLAPDDSYSVLAGCIDAADRAHIFYAISDEFPPSALSGYLVYQQISASNTVSAPAYPSVPPGSAAFGIPATDGERLLYVYADTVSGKPSFIVGSPLSAPTFSAPADLDPAFIVSDNRMASWPMSTFYAGAFHTIWGIWGGTDGTKLFISETSDFVTWNFSSSLAYDLATSVDPSFNIPGQRLQGMALIPEGISAGALDPTDTFFEQYFFPLPGPPSPAAAGKTLTGGQPGLVRPPLAAGKRLAHGLPSKLIAGGIASGGKVLRGGVATLAFPTTCQEGGQPQVGPG